MDQSKGQPSLVETNYKAPDWHPSQTLIYGKEFVRRGQQRKRSKQWGGQQRKATIKVRESYWHPTPMGNSGNGSVGNIDWRPYPMGHQGNR